nr:MAG TPA: hypothetical protein [Caudoviricetes sp.]
MPVRTVLAPVRRLAPPAAAARERPRGQCMPGCTPPATTARSASLRGRAVWANRCAAMAYTPLEHSLHTTVGPGRRAVHARVHTACA